MKRRSIFPHREMLDEIVDLLVETVCSARKTIRVAGDDYPAELVKAKLMKLDSGHIEFVFDCLKENTTKIRNFKKYLLAVLFNAPLMSSTSCAYTVPVLLIRLAIWLTLTPIFCSSAVCARMSLVSMWTI